VSVAQLVARRGHRSIAPWFKSRADYVRMVFHLSFRLISFGGRSADLGYRVHKRGRKTTTNNNMSASLYLGFSQHVINNV